jgi:hypothetical protein
VIRRLRVRHRRAFGVLAVLLPVGFIAALAVRPEFPLSETSPGELLGRGSWPPVDMQAPDILVYLVPGEFAGSELPDGAVLLGRSPGELEEGGHTLVYYSLAHGEIVHLQVVP